MIADISTLLKNIDIDIHIDIDKENLQNINIDEILNRLEFGISNTPMARPALTLDDLVFGQTRSWLTTQQGGAVDGGGEGPGRSG